MYFLIGGGVCFGEGLWLDCHEEFSWLDLPRRILSDTAVLEGIHLGFLRGISMRQKHPALFFFSMRRVYGMSLA